MLANNIFHSDLTQCWSCLICCRAHSHPAMAAGPSTIMTVYLVLLVVELTLLVETVDCICMLTLLSDKIFLYSKFKVVNIFVIEPRQLANCLGWL